jgi:hypothetical protein
MQNRPDYYKHKFSGRKKRDDKKARHVRRAREEHDNMTKPKNKIYFLNTILEKIVLDRTRPRKTFTIDIVLVKEVSPDIIYEKVMGALNEATR